MIGETAPVRAALDALEPGADEDIQSLVQIAFYEGVHPRKGFEWVLERFGICNAITTLGGQELPHAPEDKQFCIQRLVRALYEELRERLVVEIERHDGKRPEIADAPPDTPGVVLKLIEGRDWLFADDFYHIDMSHLSSVVQMSIHLPKCPELALARELCAYGRRLSSKFVGAGDPPFEDQYTAYDLYLTVLQGENVDEALSYFRKQRRGGEPGGSRHLSRGSAGEPTPEAGPPEGGAGRGAQVPGRRGQPAADVPGRGGVVPEDGRLPHPG